MKTDGMKTEHTAAKDQYPALRTACQGLWEQCFEDSDRYVTYYFEQKWKHSETFTRREDNGKIVSMLHLNPYRLNYQDQKVSLHYIVGVSTDQSRRHRGYMRQVLCDALQWMQQRGEPFTYLMPADRAIYETFGFRSFYRAYAPVKSVVAEKGQGIMLRPFQKIEPETRRRFIQYIQLFFRKQAELYVQRDLSYFRDIACEMEACQGELLVMEREGEPMGYLAYGLEEEEPEIFEAAGDTEPECIISAFADYLKQWKNKETKTCQLDAVCPMSKQSSLHHEMMGRITDLPAFAGCFAPFSLSSKRIYIRDELLPANEGKWEFIRENRKLCARRLPDTAEVSEMTDISTFFEQCMHDKKCFLNELV